MPSPSRNAIKRAASEDLDDLDRSRNPSFRGGGLDRVKLEEVPIDVSLFPGRSKHGLTR
jgi:hypothetical protein